MTSVESSQTSQESTPKGKPILPQLAKAGLARWKLETLTGLLGFKALRNHQAETERNIAAENAHVRRTLWGDSDTARRGADDMEQIVLGDLTTYHTAAPGKQRSSIGTALAGAAIGAAVLGIPGAGIAGYLLANGLSKTPSVQVPATPLQPDNSLDVGLLHFEDLKP